VLVPPTSPLTFPIVPPPEVVDACAHELASVPPHERELFDLRLHRWWPDLLSALGEVYPEPGQVALAAATLAASAFASRDAELKRLDLRRSLEPDWFQRPDVVGYAAYTDLFAGTPAGGAAVPLRAVADRIGHLEDLGVRYLHLLPLLQPRPGEDDGGYAVMDYRTVRPDLGTTQDLRHLTRRLRERGISLCLDLVINHVAREHDWAVRARAGEERYRRYFHVFADRTEPDAWSRTLPDVFPDFAPGSFTHDAELDGWVWTTFNTWQWDLAWDNLYIFVEIADVICFLANLGVEVLRLDAIAFLWKRMGTNCQNQPEVHAITQALHAVTRIACPAVLFKAEAIVGPTDLVSYLGLGERHAKVSDLAYHNSLMVQIWSMLASRDVRLGVQALRAIPPVPTTTAWITYARCHDDIGWAIDDGDAAGVGLSGHEHRTFLSDFYSGRFPGSFARGLVFQHNEQTGDRRISGSLAALAGVAEALEADDPWRLDDAVARVLLVHALFLGWGGIPVIWSGDEIGSLGDPDWADHPRHAGDNRWVHRPALDWDVVEAAHTSSESAWSARIFSGLRRLVRARQGLPHLHASVRAEPDQTPDLGVLSIMRRHPTGPMLGLYNVTESPRLVPDWWLQGRGLDVGSLVDAITGSAPPLDDAGAVRMARYSAVWLTQSDQGPRSG